jgi:hypothetical protein
VIDPYLALYYKTDADVTEDYELQNWDFSHAAGGPLRRRLASIRGSP